jgi:hypothetical protein
MGLAGNDWCDLAHPGVVEIEIFPGVKVIEALLDPGFEGLHLVRPGLG